MNTVTADSLNTKSAVRFHEIPSTFLMTSSDPHRWRGICRLSDDNCWLPYGYWTGVWNIKNMSKYHIEIWNVGICWNYSNLIGQIIQACVFANDKIIKNIRFLIGVRCLLLLFVNQLISSCLLLLIKDTLHNVDSESTHNAFTSRTKIFKLWCKCTFNKLFRDLIMMHHKHLLNWRALRMKCHKTFISTNCSCSLLRFCHHFQQKVLDSLVNW